MLKFCRFHLPALGLFAIALAVSPAQQPAANPTGEDYIRASYTKYEFRSPMRDGKRLFTAVYEDDASGVEVLVLPHP
jgi:hypothetical protein